MKKNNQKNNFILKIISPLDLISMVLIPQANKPSYTLVRAINIGWVEC